MFTTLVSLSFFLCSVFFVCCSRHVFCGTNTVHLDGFGFEGGGHDEGQGTPTEGMVARSVSEVMRSG